MSHSEPSQPSFLRQFRNSLYWIRKGRFSTSDVDLPVQEQVARIMRARFPGFANQLDPATGLLREGAARTIIISECQRVQRTKDPLSIVLLDVDDCSRLNQVLGRSEVDRMVAWLGYWLLERVRCTDVVARVGVDGFLLILPETGSDGALCMGKRLLSDLKQESFFPSARWQASTQQRGAIPIPLSGGIATSQLDGDTFESLRDAAEANLRESQSGGGGRLVATDESGASSRQLTGVLGVLWAALEKKDHYTTQHSEGVSDYAYLLSQKIDLPFDEQRTLRLAGLIHDIGKFAIPDRILRKPTALSKAEYDVVKQHVTVADGIIREIPSLRATLDAVLCHHERWDGSGYPRGLVGEEIPLHGRIMAIADCFSAMTLDRPYHKGKQKTEALLEIEQMAGKHFEPELARAFVTVMTEAIEKEASEAQASAEGTPNGSSLRRRGARRALISGFSG